jgi:hypothetical protein
MFAFIVFLALIFWIPWLYFPQKDKDLIIGILSGLWKKVLKKINSL